MTVDAANVKVVVVGAGAVGGYFGGVLARSGVDVTLIGRPAFVEAVQQNGLYLDTTRFKEFVPVNATTDLAAVHGADLVLFCVKTTDTPETARAIKPHLSPNAVVVSLQNGVSNVSDIREASGIEALPSVVYVAAAMPEPGKIKHSSRGELVMGPPSEKVNRVAEFLSAHGVPVRVAENIEGELWLKYLWNCASNALTAAGRCTYGQAAASPDARKLLENSIYEVAAVAKAAGITLPAMAAPREAVEKSIAFMSALDTATSSTAQDVARHRRTEVDSLNGYLCKLGEKYGVPTPVNQALYAVIKLQELSFK